MRIRKSINAMAGLLLLAGCASNYSPAKYALHTELVTAYRLDSGDQLRVIVFGQSDLTSSYAIDKAGMISMPLIGTVPARDRTTAQIEADIGARLRAGYLKNPDVSVEVDRYRPFFVMGEVNAAGQYSYVTGTTVLTAVATAGGFSPRADQYSVKVTRSFNGEIETASLKMTDPVMPGDTIYVRERLF
jgi:polysaccharide export outer membrane protein